MTQFLGEDVWMHQPAGSAFQDNQYLYCKITAATPADPTVDSWRGDTGAR